MTTTEKFSETQALDEAVLLFTRKMRRMAPEAFAKAMTQMPDGARYALSLAERTADRRRGADTLASITREYVDPFADDEPEDGSDETDE